MECSVAKRWSRYLIAALAWVGVLWCGGAASALPVSVFFDGPADASGRRLGVSATSAAAAQAAGLPWIAPRVLQDAPASLRLVMEEITPADVSISPPGQPPRHQALATGWVEAVSGSGGTGGGGAHGSSLHVVFRSAGPGQAMLEGIPTLVEYDETRVGLSLDPALGWKLLQVPDPVLGVLNLPALDVPEPSPGGGPEAFSALELVTQSLHDDGKGGVVWPRLRAELAMLVVPESQTGALLLSGLVLLASRQRQRGRRLAGS